MLKTVFVLFLYGLVSSSIVLAFQVDVPKDTFNPAERSGRTRTVLITNKNQDLIAVELAILSRNIDLDGNEPEGGASSDFDVYPSQLLINPGEEAYVTLIWKGDMPKKELAYRIESKDIPFNDSSQVKMGLVKLLVGRRYLNAAYVTPPGAKPNIQLFSMVPSANGDQKELVVTLENTGTAHKVVSNFAVNVTHRVEGGREVVLSQPVVLTDPKFRQKVNILPDGKRRFIMAWPENLPLAPLKGALINVE